jgi:CheY-like chemotaxis protein
MATILIIDDDDAFRDGLAETIQDLGYTPLEARSGEEAIERLREEASPDCIFLDFRLPGADGLSVLETLRGTAGLQDVPVVMLTAYATSDNTIGAMRLGAFEHLTKPVAATRSPRSSRAFSQPASIRPLRRRSTDSRTKRPRANRSCSASAKPCATYRSASAARPAPTRRC